MVHKGYNFRAVLGTYIGIGVIVALLIHFLLNSPRYNWMPQGGAMQTQVNRAPGSSK